MTQTVLHQCNVNQIKCLDCFYNLVSDQDTLIFYGHSLTENKYNSILQKVNSNKVYFLITNNPELSNLDYKDWVKLVKEHSKTLTWH